MFSWPYYGMHEINFFCFHCMVKSRNLVYGHIQDVCSIPMFQKFVVEEICFKFLPVLILEYDKLLNASLI